MFCIILTQKGYAQKTKTQIYIFKVNMGSCSGFSPKYKLGVFMLKNEELKTAINISIVIVK